MAPMLLADLAQASAEVASTRSRSTKTRVLAETLDRAAPEEAEVVACYLSGVLRQRRTGVGWRALTDLPPPAATPLLTVLDVDAACDRLAELAGAGSGRARVAALADLFGRATDTEQAYLRGLFTGEVRQGALDGLLLDAVASTAAVPGSLVRRAAMLGGATPVVAAAALTGGREALEAFRLVPGRPLRPMLASTAADLEAALVKAAPHGGAVAVEGKLDGVRVQVHRMGAEVRIYSRTLDDLTARLPELVEAARHLPADVLVLDGEALTLDPSGRPRPFQETAARTATRGDVNALREAVPVSPYFFDLLHVDGRDLLDEPGRVRRDALASVVPAQLRVPSLVTDDPAEAAGFAAHMRELGHEGVVVKGLSAPYEAGRRGAAWVKVKPRHTLDLVVLAVEWGSGRRRGFLSNIHLGAWDPASGEFVMLGKTFKGMTDSMLAWQTERFLSLETGRSGHVVHVRPEQVVEVAFDGVQASPRYPAGMALRFARVVRYRDDKTAADADTVETVRAIHGG